MDELRNDPMMAHLMDSLQSGKDIGHYGRLVFAMVARHFMDDEQLVQWLTKGDDTDDAKARALVHQVSERDYSPPRREKILQYQSQQDFPIIPNPDDPDAGNVYRNLKMPEHVYEHIEESREAKASS